MEANGYSIKGRKPKQEDAFYISGAAFQDRLVLVADGVGGHGHGDFASQLCVAVFAQAFEAGQGMEDVPVFLKATAQEIAQRIFNRSSQNPEYRNCGTTLTGFLVRGDQFYWINIGDSRVYLYDHLGHLQQLSKDHSYVQLQIDAGLLLPEEARHHLERHQMYSALGLPPEEMKMDIEGPLPLRRGDELLAFSDGVHDALTDGEIADFLRAHRNDPHLCRKLVETAFDTGGTDNITACWYRHVSQEP